MSTRQAADFLPLASGLAAALGDLRDRRILWEQSACVQASNRDEPYSASQKARLNKAIETNYDVWLMRFCPVYLDIVLLDRIFLRDQTCVTSSLAFGGMFAVPRFQSMRQDLDQSGAGGQALVR